MLTLTAWRVLVRFVAVILSAPLHVPMLFAFGACLIGLGGGLFAHGTLTATMNNAPKEQIGLALGAWGAVQATAAGVGVALGGVLRDLVVGLASVGQMTPGLSTPAAGYTVVYVIEIMLLFATLFVMVPLLRRHVGEPVTT